MRGHSSVSNAMGGGGVSFPEKKRYKGVRFNVISFARGWVGVKFPGKKRYVTLEWPLMDCIMKFLIRNAYLPVTIFTGYVC